MNTVLAVGLFSLITIVAVPGNLLVMLTFVLKNRLHQTRYLLLASLALSDFLFQFLVNIFKIASVARQEWIFGHRWCQISSIIADICYRSTMLHLCAITVEAYVPLIRPLHYQRNITRAKLMWLLCLWVVPALCSVAGWKFKVYNPAVFGCQQAWNNDNFVNRLNVLGTALIFFVIPLIIIASLQIVMVVLPLMTPAVPRGLYVHCGIPLVLPVRHSDCRNTCECEKNRTPASELPMNEISDKIVPNLLQMPQQTNNEPANSNSESEYVIAHRQESMEINLDKDDLQFNDMGNRGNSTFDVATSFEHPFLRQVQRESEIFYHDSVSKGSAFSQLGLESAVRKTEREDSPNNSLCVKPARSHSCFEMTSLDLQYSRHGSMKLHAAGSASSKSDICHYQEAKSIDRHFNIGDALSRSKSEQSAAVSAVLESKVGIGTNIREIEGERSLNSRPHSRNRNLERNPLQPIKSKQIHERPWNPGGGKHLRYHRRVRRPEPSNLRRNHGNNAKGTHVRSKLYVEEPDRTKTSSGEFVPSNVCKTETDTKTGSCHIIDAEIHFEVNTRREFPPHLVEYSAVSSSNICKCDAYSDNNVLTRSIDNVDSIKYNNTGIARTNRESIGSIDDCSAKTNRENRSNVTESSTFSSNNCDDFCSVGELIEGCVVAESDNFNRHSNSVNDINDHNMCNNKLDKHFDMSRRNEEKIDVRHDNNNTHDNKKENVVNNTTTIKHRKKDLRASRDIFIVTSVFILCFLPLWVAAFCKKDLPKGQLPDDVELICQWFAFTSTFCNSIIYCIRKREFRRALAQLVRPVASRLV